MRWLALAALLAFVGAACSNGTDNSPDGANAQFAQDTCRKSIEKQLLSPATAHFHDETRTYTGTGETFDVTGEVDSENGFGATLTTSWTCTATGSADGRNWTATATLNGQ